MIGRDGMSDEQVKNTDREIWRKIPDDYYSPSIHVTKDGGIGMNVGGLVHVRPVEEWHGMIAELQESQRALGEIVGLLQHQLDNEDPGDLITILQLLDVLMKIARNALDRKEE